jgi:predicted RecB family endonuclease
MSEVVSVDFGKVNREHGRRLTRLMGIIEKHEQELLDDPRRLYDMAMAHIAAHARVIREAQDALRPRLDCSYPTGPIPFEPMRTVHVDAAEYARLKKAAAIIERGVTP